METAHPYIDQVVAFFREGFYSVNAIQGLIIALVAAFIMPGWSRLWAVVLGATVVHLIANVLIPVVAGQAAFKLPPLVEVGYWRDALVLFVGYLVVISVFYFLRRSLLKGGH